ncbi:hypothetical protein [Flagellimonas lutimaris]|uniref:hypothetical protein n=1 Tax=Flagellimonas lutimaris TaxID=475082 RepID=UPI003F5CF1A9
MKKILGYAVLFLFISTGARAQDFDLGDVMGEAQEFFGEAQKKAEHQAADTEAQKEFEAAFKAKFKKMGAYLKELDNYSAETKCTYMILKYQMSVDSLIAATAAEKNCKRKYDLYGMQLMAKMSSTSIMYCTEDLFNMFMSDLNTNEEKEKINQLTTDIAEIIDKGGRMIVSRMFGGGDPADTPDFFKTFVMTYAENEGIMDDSLSYDRKKEIVGRPIELALAKYFHPVSLLRSTVEISKQMDKLKPCAGL